VIPDVDIATKVGKDLFLDEKIPRHESGRGYVRVVEHSALWKDKEASKVFTYQGLTTCTEVDKSWTPVSTRKDFGVGWIRVITTLSQTASSFSTCDLRMTSSNHAASAGVSTAV
jgi:hypothetical protein